MAGPLLETKLHVPKLRRGLVARPRLSERLSRGSESTLLLVSAPAGFGKTTLLTEWLADASADRRSAAWLSLDQRDNDPVVFWTYLVAALQAAVPEVGANALPLLQSSRSSTEVFLTALLNDLQTASNDVVLVLDDFHVIEAPAVRDGVAFLVEHLPPHIHLVIASRADPALPLARMRARGELVEIRADDLRFTPDETAAYLNEAMALTLMVEDVSALAERTEGWIAALQLAALSMQGRDDITGFISDFAGDDRYIVDYLVEEVLQRQPGWVRGFLLQTSILSRLNGSLCDAVTGQTGGKATLEAFDRGNLFLIPLDDRRQWYRYHHLFADVLRARLLDEQPDVVAELHARAGDWFEHNGDLPEAIRHAMAGGQFEKAADLIERALPAMRQARQEVTLRHLLEALPGELLEARPELSVMHAGVMLITGEVDGVEARLRDAERWLEHAAAEREAEPGEDRELRGLSSEIAIYRAAQAWALGDGAGTIVYARRALDLIGEDNPVEYGAAAGMLGLAHWASGELTTAHRWWTESVAQLRKGGHLSDVAGCSIALADIRITQGRLREAMSTYERGLTATTQADSALRGAADMHVGMSELFREGDDLETARRHLHSSSDLGEPAGLAQNRYRWRVAMARILQAEGDPDAAIELLDEAERLYDGDFFPNVRPVAAVRARVWIAEGRVGDALAWARERGLSPEDGLSYLREYEHITLARLLLAQHAIDRDEHFLLAATLLLDRLRHTAEAGERTGSVIEILVLQALAQQTLGNTGSALGALRRALELAEPEGYLRIFADEGAPLVSLLRAAAKQGVAPHFVRRILTATGTAPHGSRARQRLIEPLSERELDVLRLLGSELNGPAIARELVVSLNTVRTHTKNIYAKLGVTNRRAAVRRAEELDLLSRG